MCKLPDIIAITETWATVENVDLCNIDEYTGHHAMKDGRRGGGVYWPSRNERRSQRRRGIIVLTEYSPVAEIG